MAPQMPGETEGEASDYRFGLFSPEASFQKLLLALLRAKRKAHSNNSDINPMAIFSVLWLS